MNFFISYSHANADEGRLAEILSQGLTHKRHRVFIDTRIQAGDDWVREIDHHLKKCGGFVVLLSRNSVSSEMVQAEIRLAHRYRKQGKKIRIIPVRVRYAGPLDYELESYLGRLQYLTWDSPNDSEEVLRKIAEAVEKPLEARDADRASVSDWLDMGREPVSPDASQPPLPAIDPRLAYAPGGTLRMDDPCYVRRPADATVEELTRHNGETLVIKGPRQVGKSSLLLRYLAGCQSTRQTVFIDLSVFSEVDLKTISDLLTNIARIALHKLRLGQNETPDIKTSSDLTWWLEDHVFPHLNSPLVFAFDEVDRVLGRGYQNDFFSLLRHWHNNRAMEPDRWANFDLALSISTEPYLLIDEGDRSPFNVGCILALEPFTPPECLDLNRIFDSLLPDDRVRELWELLGGHPYLTRLAYYHLIRPGGFTFEKLTHPDSSIHEHGPFGDHLRALLMK
ncbi:MAG: toll/interleukin-1 receptor domain-containing protein, partial [Desulfobacterales bacterium]|nr:toll/interleukin-1 receptor domain-containing protein [Desulfobacterales bacterium]